MQSIRLPLRTAGICILIGLSLVAGCAKRATTGAFVDTRLIGTELHRGQSTKTDVRRVLGQPAGNGAAMLPTQATSREVWFYDDIEAIGAESIGGGLMRVDIRQQILLVFFEKDLFDGFMWYSNAGPASVR